jgi:zinc protease
VDLFGLEFLTHGGAAPHLPTGILSPYRNGERNAVIAGFANHQRLKHGAEAAASVFLPVTIRGEMPGRAMRDGTDIDNCCDSYFA